jgi:hypothetical protein
MEADSSRPTIVNKVLERKHVTIVVYRGEWMSVEGEWVEDRQSEYPFMLAMQYFITNT